MVIRYDHTGTRILNPVFVLKDYPAGHGLSARRIPAIGNAYNHGIGDAHYPVPSCIVHVGDAGLANGLEQRNPDGSLVFKAWDTPMSNGEWFVFNGMGVWEVNYADDFDATDWY